MTDDAVDQIARERYEAVKQRLDRWMRFPDHKREIVAVERVGFGEQSEVRIEWRDHRHQGQEPRRYTQTFPLIEDDWDGFPSAAVAADIWLEIFET